MNYSQISEAQIAAFLNDPKIMVLLAIFSIWALIWKGIALWKASKNDNKYWFIALLLINTIGILEIIYIFYFSKKKSKAVI